MNQTQESSSSTLQRGAERLAESIRYDTHISEKHSIDTAIAADPGVRALVDAAEQTAGYLERLAPDHPDMPASQCRADLLRAALKLWEQG